MYLERLVLSTNIDVSLSDEGTNHILELEKSQLLEEGLIS